MAEALHPADHSAQQQRSSSSKEAVIFEAVTWLKNCSTLARGYFG
jgi:hypothetical protein